jgi:hypothetical protein
MRPLAITAACLLVFLAACGGSKSEKPAFDVAKAELLAHDALIQTRDLPGSGWSVTDEDPKESDDDDFPTTDACKQLRDFQSEVKNLDQKSRAARAKREISKPNQASPLPTEVSVEIEIYKDTKDLPGHAERARKMVEGDSYTNCFSEVMGDIFKAAGLTATTKGVTPSASVPGSGFAFAAESQVTGLSSALRFENYGWILSNAKITVSLSGSRDALTPEIVKAAVEKTQAKLNELKQ